MNSSSSPITRKTIAFVTAVIDVEEMLFTFEGRHRLLLTSVIYRNVRRNSLKSPDLQNSGTFELLLLVFDWKEKRVSRTISYL